MGGNITKAMHHILSKQSGFQAPVLVSLIGVDITGGVPRSELSRTGVRTGGLAPISGKACVTRNMVLDTEGGILIGVANMDIIESLEGKVASLSPFTLWPY